MINIKLMDCRSIVEHLQPTRKSFGLADMSTVLVAYCMLISAADMVLLLNVILCNPLRFDEAITFSVRIPRGALISILVILVECGESNLARC